MSGKTIEKSTKRQIEKLRALGRRWLQRGNREKALRTMTALAKVEYFYNQRYTDEWIEQSVMDLADQPELPEEKGDSRTVLFYDGFDYQSKGLVLIYLKALAALGYRIIYISCAEEPGEASPVKQILKKTDYRILNIRNEMGQEERIRFLRSVMREESFGTAFFYTKPWDIAGAVAFREMEGKARRYLINLTDHAFWVGRNSVDYVIEFRDYGAGISHDYRGFELSRLLKLPYYPIISRETAFQGFPKETEGKRIIFSGGSLYKTMDQAGTYYRIVEKILQANGDTAFVYAGTGDDRHLKQLTEKMPGRVFHIAERSDLYEVMRHSDLYLNTYPISGGLMVQYAAEAGCVPVTLRRPWDDDAVGMLRNEEALGETFMDEEAMLAEIRKLLRDEDYRREKQRKLAGSVISGEEFTETLRGIIEKPESPYIRQPLRSYDTTLFRKAYLESINPEDIRNAVINHETAFLIPFFPGEFTAVARRKIREKI